MRCRRLRTILLALRQSTLCQSVGGRSVPVTGSVAWACIYLFPHLAFLASLFGYVTWVTSAPFRDGYLQHLMAGPIRRVMDSPCLATAGPVSYTPLTLPTK